MHQRLCVSRCVFNPSDKLNSKPPPAGMLAMGKLAVPPSRSCAKVASNLPQLWLSATLGIRSFF